MTDPTTILTRRRLLQFGAGGYLGLNLGGLWGARAAAQGSPAGAKSIKACVLIFYYGGPSHIDTFDPKPDAPAEVRGEFKSVTTSAPGVRVCEHLPRLARLMHKIALVRSVHHAARLHDSASIHVLTGRPLDGQDRELFAPLPQFYPSYGSAVAYMNRRRPVDVPFASLPYAFHNVVPTPCQGAGFLGPAYDPLRIDVDPERRLYPTEALQLAAGLNRGRVLERRDLLQCLDGSVRAGRPVPEMYEKAYRLLDSEIIRRVLDISQEPPAVRDRYGIGPDTLTTGDGGEKGFARQMRGQNLLLARRLVEAGVPFVNVYDFKQQGQNWDAHVRCAQQHKSYLLPQADQSLAALIEDLDERGLLDSTLVVAVGEFGRTPKINAQGGRDHWPDCYTALLAGGGVRGGAVYGSSDKLGAYPATDPVTPGDLAATIYWRFGIDPETEIRDQGDRPHRIATGEPITKLFV